MTQNNNLCNVMETGDHLSNGVSPNNLMSRRNLLMIVCLTLLTIFCGCKKDDNKESGGNGVVTNDGITKLEISVENGSEYSGMIDKVKLVVWSAGMFEESRDILATVDYNNGKFTLQLPSTIAEKCFIYRVGKSGNSLSISNSNVMGMECEIAGYKGDKQVCSFYYANESEATRAYGNLNCFNSDVSITGTETRNDEYDITNIREVNYIYSVYAKRGWNILYSIEDEKGTVTETVNGIKRVYNNQTTTTDPGNLQWKVDYWNGSATTAGEELKINAQVENGTNYNNIKRVRANNSDYGYALAIGNYSNGGFSLTIPNTVRYLYYTIGDLLGDFDNELFISNRKTTAIQLGYIQGYTSNFGAWDWEDFAGNFICCKVESNSWVFTRYIFVSTDVNVFGAISNYWVNRHYNLNLKAGWNTVYITRTVEDYQEKYTWSTAPISGLKWYHEDDFNNLSSSFKSSTNHTLHRKGKIFNTLHFRHVF